MADASPAQTPTYVRMQQVHDGDTTLVYCQVGTRTHMLLTSNLCNLARGMTTKPPPGWQEVPAPSKDPSDTLDPDNLGWPPDNVQEGIWLVDNNGEYWATCLK